MNEDNYNKIKSLIKQEQAIIEAIDKDALRNLGKELLKDIVQMPNDEQVNAWGIVAHCLKVYTKENKNMQSEITKLIAEGANTSITTLKQRKSLIDGITESHFFSSPELATNLYNYEKGLKKEKADKEKTKPEYYNKDVFSNLHSIIKELHSEVKDFDEQKLKEFGAKFAKEIFKLNNNDQVFGWNIVADSVEGYSTNPNANINIIRAIGQGANDLITSAEQRDSLINGLTKLNQLMSNKNPSVKPK